MVYNQIVLLFAIPSLMIGIYVFCYPLKTIEIQQKFYAMINWRIEPISLPKEIRNTRIMGGFLVVFVLSTCLVIYLR